MSRTPERCYFNTKWRIPDFFVDHAALPGVLGVDTWLLDRGFVSVGDHQQATEQHYADHPYTEGVYRHDHPAGRVEVQVVTDVEVARRTRDLIYYSTLKLDDDRLRREDKTARAEMWVYAARAILAGRPSKALAAGEA